MLYSLVDVGVQGGVGALPVCHAVEEVASGRVNIFPVRGRHAIRAAVGPVETDSSGRHLTVGGVAD